MSFVRVPFPAPVSLMDSDGKPKLGYFDTEVGHLSLDAFQYQNVMDKPASRWAKHFHYKQFQFVSIVTPDYIIGFAIADIRYLASGFAYVYDREKDSYEKYEWVKPKGVGYSTEPSPSEGRAFLGNTSKYLEFSIVRGQWSANINLPFIKCSICLQRPEGSKPLALCNQTGYNGWTYTQKHNTLTVLGEMIVHGNPICLDNALANYDFSAGYMRRDTSWRWASLNGRTETGTVGFNLANGVNETGLNENALWINGERHLLGPVVFDFDRGDVSSPWRIYSFDGRLDLSFQPANFRKEKLNLWLLRSNFRQFVGVFSGYIHDSDGNKYVLDDMVGLTEDHYARW
ncbi:hypothetical protein CS022_10660 [Veronia nyctiphanis]|uniref:DUF2804 domain-containing protein n=2 Tax=Veronia nyctiphanis TaxID=1278244 RepID=A0A4Q0YT11_9GAMM|nr:hypothetical protein CS022_10660 [Veronia nyctiphanis]